MKTAILIHSDPQAGEEALARISHQLSSRGGVSG